MDKKYFTQFPVLQTQRLVLREITNSDLHDALPIMSYEQKPASSLEEAEVMNNKINYNYRSGNSINWGIALRDQNKIIGAAGFYRGFASNTGEVGYVLKEDFRGKGVMIEAVNEILKFGFTRLKLSEIVAYTSEDNLPSISLLKKLGFRETGNANPEFKFSLKSADYKE